MEILQRISAQISVVGLPLYAVTVTAVPRADTPVLLMLHWHGFRRAGPSLDAMSIAVPGSALQLNDRWRSFEAVDTAMLNAAWQLGAWDVQREERRACNDVGASEREALECRQAFGDHSLHSGHDTHLIEEAPDRKDLMQLGAEMGYIRWQFRPVKGGLWQTTAEDDTLAQDGSRTPPCPVPAQSLRGGRTARTFYRLGRINRIILP